MIETSHVESEVIMPESHFESRSYKITYQCLRCGKPFKKTYKYVPNEDPPCPRFECKAAVLLENQQREIANLKAMIESGVPPAHIGANTMVKAVDATADIVMQNYGMTDLQDNVRMGDAVAPKLPVAQQQAADNYFGPKGGVPVVGMPGQRMRARQLEAIGRRAIGGAYRGNAVPPNAVTPNAAQGQPALRMVGTEPTGRK